MKNASILIRPILLAAIPVLSLSAVQATNYFGGLLHAALGNAIIQSDPSRQVLTVSAIGSSGNDGVRILTGGGGGATARLGVFDPDALPIDASLKWAALDPTGLRLQVLTVQRVATGGALFADFNGLGAPTVTVSLYDHDALVASAARIPPTQPFANFGGGVPGGGGGGLPINVNPCVLHPEDCYGVIDIDVLQPDPAGGGSMGSIVTIPGHASVRCTRVQIQPELPVGAAPSPWRVRHVEITGRHLGTMNIEREGLIYFGLEHHAAGQSQYRFDEPEAFTLANPGASDADGMDVTLRNARGYSADWVALNPQPLPPDRVPELNIRAVGDWNGRPDSLIGVVQMRDFGSSLPIVGDFAALGSRSQQIQLWNNGAQVATYSVANGSVDVAITNHSWLPSGVLISPAMGSAAGSTSIQFALHWMMGMDMITPAGQQFVADEVRVIINDVTLSLDALTRVSYRLAGWEGLTFKRESALRPPVIECPTNPAAVALPCSSNCVPVSYSVPASLNGAAVSCNPPPGACLSAGTHTVVCTAGNALGQAVCSFDVPVVPEPIPLPVVQCPPDIVATTCGFGEGVIYPAPVVTTAAPGEYTLVCAPPSGSFFPVGTNKVVCCVTDRCGRTTCCEFNVILPKGITFAGIQHCPLGVATLTKDAAGGTLSLGNITETGLDGVQIALGEADFIEAAFPFMPMPGESCRYEYRAVVDDIADRPAAILTVGANAAGEMLFTGDMSPLGATRYTVLVLDGETQVASISNQPVANVTAGGNAVHVAPSLRWDIKTYKCYIRVKLPKIPGSPGPPVRLAAGRAVNGDAIIILPENPTRRVGAQNRLLLTATAIHPEPKLILGEQLGLFGTGHTGLGDAMLTANGGTLTVGNLGVSANNGVAMDLESSHNFLASFGSIHLPAVQGPQPVPWIQARVFGQFGAALNHDLGSLCFTGFSPTAVEVAADFTPVGAGTHTVEVWQGGQLVRRITGRSGSMGTVNAWPSGIGTLRQPGPNQSLRAMFTGGVRINVTDGPTLEGDELRVLAENPSAPTAALQSLNLRASGVDSFSIVNETREPALAPRPGNISPAPAGGLQITIPTAFGYQYTLESVNALGPQPLPWAVVETFAGDGSLKVVPLDNTDLVSQFYRVGVENPSGPPVGGPLPDLRFPHKVFLNLDNVIVDETRNPQQGDRPYFVTIQIQTRFNTPGSTKVEVVECEPHDWVSKHGNPIFLNGRDRMRPGDTLSIPPCMGRMEWDDVQWTTVQDLITQCLQNPGEFKPQIMLLGAVVIGLDNHNTPPHEIRSLANRLADALKQQLAAQVETGNVLNGVTCFNAQQALNDLRGRFGQLAVDAGQTIKVDFGDVFQLTFGSLCDPDVPVGANVLFFPAIPGIPSLPESSDTFPFPNFNCAGITSFDQLTVGFLIRTPELFSPTLLFRRANAAYRVNARVIPDFVPPPPPPPNQPDPTLVNVVTIATQTGGDNLRGSSAAIAEISIKNRNPETFRLNDPNQEFQNDFPHAKTFLLSSPAPYGDILSITLRVVQGQCGGCTGDNWNVDFLEVSCWGSNIGLRPLLSKRGKPLVRLVEQDEHPENNEFRQKTFPFLH